MIQGAELLDHTGEGMFFLLDYEATVLEGNKYRVGSIHEFFSLTMSYTGANLLIHFVSS